METNAPTAETPPPLPLLNAAGAAGAFAALGAPQRLGILQALVRAGPAGLAMGQLAQRLDMAGSTLNHHARALVEAGLVRQTRQGRSIIAAADYEAVRRLSDYLLRECCADLGEEARHHHG